MGTKKPVAKGGVNVKKYGVGAAAKGPDAKKKKIIHSDDDEDFIVEDEAEDADEDFMLSDEEEKRPRKKRTALDSWLKGKPKKSTSNASNKPSNNALGLGRKVRTLSESSEDEWLCKPRLDENAKLMKTRVTDFSVKKLSRIKAVLSDESDEDQEENLTSASTLKNVAKAAAKHGRKRKGSSDEEYNDDGASDKGSYRGGHSSEEATSDSDDDEHHSRNGEEDDVMLACLEFFNTSTPSQLSSTPRMTEKIVSQIVERRPFSSFSELESAISEIPRGTGALNAYMEFLENRGVLEKILDDCKDHALSVAAEFEKCTNRRLKPALLDEKCTLHEYQHVGLNWLVMMHEKGFNCILGDEMIDVILTTYNMISSKHDDKKFFKNFSIHYVVYDEGHMLKNCGTDRYRNLMKVKQGPALESGSCSMYQKDRIEQAKLILQPYMLRRLKTQVLYHLPEKHEEVIEVEMLENQKELYENVLESVRGVDGDTNNAYGALMRLRQAANHPLLRRVQYTDSLLDKLAKTLCAKEKPYEKKRWEDVAEDLSYQSDFQIHQICEKFRSTKKFLLCEDLALESGKCQVLDKLLPKIKSKGDKVLIFSQFTSMLDILEVYLRIREYSYRRLDGSTPVMDRQEMINEFNNDPELCVFLLSTRAGGLGINLTSANHIILHDIDFNPYNDKQAEDRCHRMGQEKEVFVTKLVSKDTVEADIHCLARKKLQLEKAVTDGIKGQLEENDEVSRESAGSKEEKPDSDTLCLLLNSALKRKSVGDTA
ncbi:helicase protein [Teladorsagia circumcincta]|uniref:Helicase protein n=1 Tax=Teladorsagia circumcincta TaxID=45464 RepID=A0A2G9UDF9_TELCI|nr:helicase protein [Teladorsagia circumcincta]